jgi:hypothetical protein
MLDLRFILRAPAKPALYLKPFGFDALVPVDYLFSRYPQLALMHLCLQPQTRSSSRRRQSAPLREDELVRAQTAECHSLNVQRHSENLFFVADVLYALLKISAVPHFVRRRCCVCAISAHVCVWRTTRCGTVRVHRNSNVCKFAICRPRRSSVSASTCCAAARHYSSKLLRRRRRPRHRHRRPPPLLLVLAFGRRAVQRHRLLLLLLLLLLLCRNLLSRRHRRSTLRTECPACCTCKWVAYAHSSTATCIRRSAWQRRCRASSATRCDCRRV